MNIVTQQKIEINKSTTMANAVEIRMNGEGHTAASVITERLEDMADYVAYKIEHPTDNFVTIKIQSKENQIILFKKCVKSIIFDINDIIEQINNTCYPFYIRMIF